jgi:hypothetical protein
MHPLSPNPCALPPHSPQLHANILTSIVDCHGGLHANILVALLLQVFCRLWSQGYDDVHGDQTWPPVAARALQPHRRGLLQEDGVRIAHTFQFIPIGYTMTRSSLHRFKWQWGAGNLLEFVLLGPI